VTERRAEKRLVSERNKRKGGGERDDNEQCRNIKIHRRRKKEKGEGAKGRVG
jgi:hypothetical protein